MSVGITNSHVEPRESAVDVYDDRQTHSVFSRRAPTQALGATTLYKVKPKPDLILEFDDAIICGHKPTKAAPSPSPEQRDKTPYPSMKASKISLSFAINLGIAATIIPAMFFILGYGYQKLSKSRYDFLDEEMLASQKNIFSSVNSFIDPVIANLETISGFASFDPLAFKQEESRDILFRSVNGMAQIDALYVSFSDGYHRVVTRIDEDRRKVNPKILHNAHWHSSYVDAFALGEKRQRHRIFFDIWPNIIQSFDEPTNLDMRSTSQYQLAAQKMSMIITDPIINPDTGYPVISAAVPIISRGSSNDMIGIVGANLTLRALSEFIKLNQVSANSQIVITDMSGRVFAHEDLNKVLYSEDGSIVFATLNNIDDRYIREASFERIRAGKTNFSFVASDGEQIYASFLKFPNSTHLSWQLLIVVPVRDFIGKLDDTTRDLAVATALIFLCSMLIFYAYSKNIAKSITFLREQSSRIQKLDFGPIAHKSSPIAEIYELQKSFTLLQNALQSFGRYVPLAIVQDLIKRNEPLNLGVKNEELSIFFVDIENFSTLAEMQASDDLLKQLTEYLTAACESIEAELGTVDKFIGDAVMAFWGAPTPCKDHAVRACSSALRLIGRMNDLNDKWVADGKPAIRVRIGINTSEALVGNMGTPDRMNYTAIGDGVNVASRLEGVNKDYGTNICISEKVVKSAGNKLNVRYLDKIKVKGRSEELKIFELLGIKTVTDL